MMSKKSRLHNRAFGSTYQAQGGVALLTILIMLVLATLLAVSIIKQQNILLEQTRFTIDHNQRLIDQQAAESLIKAILAQNQPKTLSSSVTSANSSTPDSLNIVDTLASPWAQPLGPVPISESSVTINIEDDNRKFNLNTLVQVDGHVNLAAKTVFENLLKRLQLDPNLVDAVIDWQDSDHEPSGPMGAEDSFYRGLSGADGQPRLMANSAFIDAAQLQQVRGFTPEVYQSIAPYVIALPDRASKINVNTASVVLVSALADSLDHTTVRATLVQHRQTLDAFKTVDSFWSTAPFSSLNPTIKSQLTGLLDVKSNFFTATTVLKTQHSQYSYQSHFFRQGDQVNLYARQQTLTSP